MRWGARRRPPASLRRCSAVSYTHLRTALIFGGTSEIALAIARKLIDGRLRQVVLAVRDPEDERTVQARADLQRAGATSVDVVAFDALAPETHQAVVAAAVEAVGDLDLVVLAHGPVSYTHLHRSITPAGGVGSYSGGSVT